MANSVAILEARRQALIREFLASVQPFLHSAGMTFEPLTAKP